MPLRRAAWHSTRASSWHGRKGIGRTRSGCRAATARRIPTASPDRSGMMAALDTAFGAQWQAWWPWLAIAALGLFHGINPAMGWLFAVALGLHRGRRRVVLLSLLPIAFGHAVAVALALSAALTLGRALNPAQLARVCGVVLI